MSDAAADEVRAYIESLSEHRPSDVAEAVALTALEALRAARDETGKDSETSALHSSVAELREGLREIETALELEAEGDTHSPWLEVALDTTRQLLTATGSRDSASNLDDDSQTEWERAEMWRETANKLSVKLTAAEAALTEARADAERYLRERDEWVVNERDHWRAALEQAQAALTEARDERDEALARVKAHHDDVRRACERAEEAYQERDAWRDGVRANSARADSLAVALEQAQAALGKVVNEAEYGLGEFEQRDYMDAEEAMKHIRSVARAALAGQTTDTAAETDTATDGGDPGGSPVSGGESSA